MSSLKTFNCLYCLVIFIIGIFYYDQLAHHVFAQDLMCCSHATGSCKSVCEQISLVRLAADNKLRNQTIFQVQKFCSSQLTSFWECLNATFKDMSRGESWSGRVCCPLPHSESCRRACITATSTIDLIQGCRQSDEIAFFSCLDRQQNGDICCKNANTLNCQEACFDIFKTQLTPTKLQRQKMLDNCELTSPKVNDCIKDLIKVTPATNLHKQIHCCDLSNHSKCRETCKKMLTRNTKTTFQEIIDGLEIGGCGLPLPQEYFWQCFLKPIHLDNDDDDDNDDETTRQITKSIELVSRIDRVGMDSAKWHCCQHAINPQCQRLCSKTFTKFWSTLWDEFYIKCLNQLNEENLRNCLDEIDEPCELGCDGLSFCTNFNNRPMELFRSCNLQSDEAARNDLQLWHNQNQLKLLPNLILPLKKHNNTLKCSPNLWKTIACTLQIKPCTRLSHSNQICRNTCINILNDCIDWTKIPLIHTPETICTNLSPNNNIIDPNIKCIDLNQYLIPSTTRINNNGNLLEISSPCKNNPCELNEICLINRNCIELLKFNSNENCLPYYCKKSCKLGEVSEYHVPYGIYIRIPIPNNPKGCLKICKCNLNGKIDECQPLPCITLTSCLLGNEQQLHGTLFNLDCNQCSCYAGEIICSKKQCEHSLLSGKNLAYTTLPCNCSPNYMPVCGRNGIQYPSSCLAKCAGLSDSDFDQSPCDDPCKINNCQIGEKCIPNPKVCLSLMHKPCLQYICVNGSANCNNFEKLPVCDINNEQYDNICLLAHNNKKLAYYGECLKNCKYKGKVCGINGHTYLSECAALADMILIDYYKPCNVIGLINDNNNLKNSQCPNIKCEKLENENCLGFIPTGACCPICGGTLKLIYSLKQIDRALYVLQNTTNTNQLTLNELLKSLQRQILIAQCNLYGYITIEYDILIIIKTIYKKPTNLQLEICIRESEKIANLINMQSPRITTELSTSSLTFANIVHLNINNKSSNFIIKNSNYYLLILFSIFIMNFN